MQQRRRRHRSAGRRTCTPARTRGARDRRRPRRSCAATPTARPARRRSAREAALEHRHPSRADRAHRDAGRPAARAICMSGAGSSTWKLADMLKMAPTDWRATTDRVTNDRPLRMRSTSKRIGSSWSPRRMKYACNEWTRNCGIDRGSRGPQCLGHDLPAVEPAPRVLRADADVACRDRAARGSSSWRSPSSRSLRESPRRRQTHGHVVRRARRDVDDRDVDVGALGEDRGAGRPAGAARRGRGRKSPWPCSPAARDKEASASAGAARVNVDVTPAASASLTILDIDAIVDDAGGHLGDRLERGARRAAPRRVRRAPPADEADFLRRLLTGELRQGALAGVMADAVAEGRGRARDRGAGAPRCSAATCRRAAVVALTEGADGACRRRTPTAAARAADAGGDVRRRSPTRSRRSSVSSVEWKLDGIRLQVHRVGDDVRIFTRNLNDVTDASGLVTMTGPARRGRRARWRAVGLGDDERPELFQDTMSRFDLDAGSTLTIRFFDCLAPRRRRSRRPSAPRTARSARARDGTVARSRASSPTIPRPPSASSTEALAAGHEGVMVKDIRVAVRSGPARVGVAEGEAGAHARSRRARRGVGTAGGAAVGCRTSTSARGSGRRLRDGGQDVQGHDRRDAAMADGDCSRRCRRRTTATSSTCARKSSSRSHSTACRSRPVTREVWRCASPRSAATGTTSPLDEADTIDDGQGDASGSRSGREDEPRAAVPGHVVPRPVEEHRQAVAEADERHEVQARATPATPACPTAGCATAARRRRRGGRSWPSSPCPR